jgi:hypothetical protein
MKLDPSLGQRIRREYAANLVSPFPLDDVRKLPFPDFESLVLFHGWLEIYLSTIAGYASSADQLNRRTRIELTEAQKRMSQSFFEKHTSLLIYRDAI